MKKANNQIAKKEKLFLKKQFKEMFYFYLESEAANDAKDRQIKLYAFLKINELFNGSTKIH